MKQVEFNKKFAERLIKFTVEIMKLSDRQQKKHTLHTIFKQLIRSASSIGANVTEAHGAHTKKDFAHYFQIALKSAKETKYWLVVIKQYDKKLENEIDDLLGELNEFIKIIMSSLVTLRKT